MPATPRLDHRELNRTLLQRQHLLERVEAGPVDEVEHLLGLQAQEPVPPYLSLAARLVGFDPGAVSTAMLERRLLRLLLMRGTIHLVTPVDAVVLRPLVQPLLDRQGRSGAGSRPADGVSRERLTAAVRAALADGPLPVRELAERLAGAFPEVPVAALGNLARAHVPLVQVPPRGLWRTPGGVVYDTLESWVGRDVDPEPDVAEVVRRYLRAFGPATPADVTAWSGITGMRQVFAGLGDELVPLEDPDGRRLFDLAELSRADADLPAPVRLLGRYDNVWLSHAARDRVTPDPDKRRRWMGVNGGVACTVFVDGALEGLWRSTDTGSVEIELFRSLTRREQRSLDDEVDRLETLLRSPAADVAGGRSAAPD